MATDIAGTHPATILEVKGIYSGGRANRQSPVRACVIGDYTPWAI